MQALVIFTCVIRSVASYCVPTSVFLIIYQDDHCVNCTTLEVKLHAFV